jgi:hypothetical protein
LRYKFLSYPSGEKEELMRSIWVVVLLASTFACAGCGTEKRVKECVNHCKAEAEACEHRREANCVPRGKECAEACEK